MPFFHRLLIKDTNDVVFITLSKSLQNFIKLYNRQDSDSLNTLITSISSCFDNFPLGLKALSESLELFSILADSLDVYCRDLK